MDEQSVARLAEAIEWAETMEIELLLLGSAEEQFDFAEAFLGVLSDDPPKAIYSGEKVIDVFVNRDGMSHEEAVEWYEFNVIGSYMGENTPLFIMSFEP